MEKLNGGKYVQLIFVIPPELKKKFYKLHENHGDPSRKLRAFVEAEVARLEKEQARPTENREEQEQKAS